MNKVLCALTAAAIAVNMQISPIIAEAAFDKTVFNLDFEGEDVSTEIIDSSVSGSHVYEITNTWIDKSVYNENKIKTSNASGSTIDAGKGSFGIVRNYFGKSGNALEISGFDGGTDSGSDGNKLSIMNLPSFNKSFSGIESFDCGENGSFSVSFDFATTDFDVQFGLRSVRTLVLNEGASSVSEGLPYGKNLFVLNNDKSITIFGDKISAEDIGELETDTWYHAEIIINAKNEMGFKLNGIVIRQMQPLSAEFNGSVRGLANSVNIPVNYGKTGSGKESKRYLDNFCYAFSRTDSAEIIEDDKTEVWFDSAEDEIEFSSTDDKKISVKASSPHGIETVTLYVDGNEWETLSEAPYVFDLNKLSVGSVEVTAEAIDKAGNIVTTGAVNINVKLSVAVPLWQEDFASYKAGNAKAGDYIEMYDRLGYTENGEISEQYGNSAILAMKDEPNASTQTTGALMLVSNKSNAAKHILFEADLYVADVASQYRICLRQSGLAERNIIAVNKNGISSPDGINQPYTDSQWYRLSIDVNPKSKTYTAYAKGENDAAETVLAAGIPIGEGFSQLDEIRIYGPSAPPASSLGIDNVSVSAVEDYSIRDVLGKNDSSHEEIDYTSDSLKIYINGSVDTESVTADMFSIENDSDTIVPSKVSYDRSEKCFVLSLSGKLMYGENYIVKTSPLLPASDGSALGASMSFSVKTSQAPLWADIRKFNSKKADLSIHNNLSESKKIYVIISCYKDNVFLGMTVKEFTVNSGETKEVSVEAEAYTDGCEIHAFAWDSISRPGLISKNVFIK